MESESEIPSIWNRRMAIGAALGAVLGIGALIAVGLPLAAVVGPMLGWSSLHFGPVICVLGIGIGSMLGAIVGGKSGEHIQSLNAEIQGLRKTTRGKSGPLPELDQVQTLSDQVSQKQWSQRTRPVVERSR